MCTHQRPSKLFRKLISVYFPSPPPPLAPRLAHLSPSMIPPSTTNGHDVDGGDGAPSATQLLLQLLRRGKQAKQFVVIDLHFYY